MMDESIQRCVGQLAGSTAGLGSARRSWIVASSMIVLMRG